MTKPKYRIVIQRRNLAKERIYNRRWQRRKRNRPDVVVGRLLAALIHFESQWRAAKEFL